MDVEVIGNSFIKKIKKFVKVFNVLELFNIFTIRVIFSVNPFVPNTTFIYPLKTSENCEGTNRLISLRVLKG